MSAERIKFSDLVGKTLSRIIGANPGSDEVEFYIRTAEGGEELFARMHHHQDCCESVSIEDVDGTPTDIVDALVLRAEEVENDEPPASHKEDSWGSETWTFYRLQTDKGHLNLRWLGSSNGYYSESVNFCPGNIEQSSYGRCYY